MLKFCLVMLISSPFMLMAQTKGILKGTVRDGRGNILVGATVSLEPDHRLTQTDEKGMFFLEGLYAGDYMLEISHIGYRTYRQAMEVHGGRESRLDIAMVGDEGTLGEVNVVGRRSNPDNLIEIERSAMPITVITRREIELMGSRRLDEVLKEQTGIAITNNIAGGNRSVGVQMQGFSSEYVMVLIDGQPMVGRNSGSFDLSRISVTNIERIEIIKGAASCLFGSEAMGGAINIITRHGALQPQGVASIRYGSLNIVDATLEGETPFASNRGEVNLSANYYRTDGFNVNSRYQTQGTTVPPSDNYSLQGRTRYRLGKTTTLGATGRYGLRRSVMTRGYGTNIYRDHMDEGDINASVSLNTSYNSGLQALTRYYFTHYTYDSRLRWDNGSPISDSEFGQTVHRAEQQLAYNRIAGLGFTGGLGGAIETMDDLSLGNVSGMRNGFAYLQAEWRISDRLNALGGGRYDHHSQYGGRFNPNLGLSYSPFQFLSLKAAYGSGFKTPDFRQRFQVFTNPLVGYTVLGADFARERLQEMQAAGELSELRNYTYNQLQEDGLQAEESQTFNLSAIVQPSNKLRLELSGFFHHIKNQINSFQVATAIDGQMIYSYLNLPKVTNKGVEASVSYKPITDMDISLGYQYLLSKDQSVKDSIEAGSWPYYNLRNPLTGETFSSKPSDYWGLENRSRHMANLRIFYNYSPLDLGLTFRVNYRGKYPFGDSNGNYYIDRYDTFVDGFFLLNASVEKKLFNRHLILQVTAENIADYTDYLMPGQLGRVILAGLTYRFFRD